MRRCISIIAVLLTISTQANAHPAGDHTGADHNHSVGGFIPLADLVPERKFSFSPAVCNDPSVQYKEWIKIYDNCMYAHRDDLARSGKGTAGSQARRYIDKKCERTACDPSWLDKAKYSW